MEATRPTKAQLVEALARLRSDIPQERAARLLRNMKRDALITMVRGEADKARRHGNGLECCHNGTAAAVREHNFANVVRREFPEWAYSV